MIAAFGGADALFHPDVLGPLAVVKLAQLGIAVGGIGLLANPAGRRIPRVVGAAIVAAIYASAAASGILRGDASSTSTLLLSGVLASAVILPWGAVAQAATVLVATIALVATAAACPDGSAVLAGHRGLALVVGFLGSIAIASEHRRHRRAREHVAGVLSGQTEILERITAGASLDDVLTALATMIERHADGMRCSILLLDGDTLRYGVAPSLPPDYREATHGIVIGPTSDRAAARRSGASPSSWSTSRPTRYGRVSATSPSRPGCARAGRRPSSAASARASAPSRCTTRSRGRPTRAIFS